MNEIIIHTDPNIFRKQCQKILEENLAEYSLIDGILTAAQNGRLKSQSTMIECKSADQTIAMAMVAGLHLMVTSHVALFAKQISEYLVENKIPIPGIIGPDPAAYEFARTYCEVTKCKMKLAMNQRIYELRKIIWPKGISGELRLVSDEDVSLVAEWIEGFYLDALPWELPTKEKILEVAKARVPNKMTYLWFDHGVPVSMASLSRPGNKSITVNGVYTPPQYRRKGYAGALVAAISEEGLKRGKEFCVLYTDLNNPTSNSIYQKVGYQAIADSKNYIFEC